MGHEARGRSFDEIENAVEARRGSVIGIGHFAHAQLRREVEQEAEVSAEFRRFYFGEPKEV